MPRLYITMTGGQVTLEFVFCMIIIMLMIYGLTKASFWTGKDFAGRSMGHDEVLVQPILERYGGCLPKKDVGLGVLGGVIVGGPVGGVVGGAIEDRGRGGGDCRPYRPELGPLKQIDPYFYTPIDMNAIWEGN